MGTCSETICKHRILFPSVQHLAWLPQGRPQRNKNVGCDTWKRQFFALAVRITGKVLKIDAATGLASTELFFHSCNVFAWLPQGRPRGKQKMKPGVRKMTTFCNCGSNNLETVVVDRQLTCTKYAVSSEREGRRTSNLVDGRSLDLRKSPY